MCSNALNLWMELNGRRESNETGKHGPWQGFAFTKKNFVKKFTIMCSAGQWTTWICSVANLSIKKKYQTSMWHDFWTQINLAINSIFIVLWLSCYRIFMLTGYLWALRNIHVKMMFGIKLLIPITSASMEPFEFSFCLEHCMSKTSMPYGMAPPVTPHVYMNSITGINKRSKVLYVFPSNGTSVITSAT